MWYVKLGDFIEKALHGFLGTLDLLVSAAGRLSIIAMVLAVIIAIFALAFGVTRWYIAAQIGQITIRMVET